MNTPVVIRIGIEKRKYIYTQSTNQGVHARNIWVCKRGSDYSKTGEKLVMMEDGGFIVAFDCPQGDPAYARQKVFRAHLSAGDPTTEGRHKWEMNWKANAANSDLNDPEDWNDAGEFDTTDLTDKS